MRRRALAAACATVTAALTMTGCTSEVVTGRAVSAPGAGVTQSGARFTDAATVADVRNDVRDGVEAINTYDYANLNAALENGLRFTTGKLSADYRRTFSTVIARNAPGMRASQEATVNNVGVASVRGATASLLAFGQLTIRTKDLSEARKDPFTLLVRATRVAGRWLLAKTDTEGSLKETPPGTAGLQAAVRAASTTAVALTSFRRTTFDVDFARALSLLTGTVRADIQKNRAATLKAMTTGAFDLSGQAKAVAVEQASGTRAVVLISLNAYRIKSGGQRGDPTSQRLRLTAAATGSRWLITQIDSVGVS